MGPQGWIGMHSHASVFRICSRQSTCPKNNMSVARSLHCSRKSTGSRGQLGRERREPEVAGQRVWVTEKEASGFLALRALSRCSCSATQLLPPPSSATISCSQQAVW